MFKLFKKKQPTIAKSTKPTNNGLLIQVAQKGDLEGCKAALSAGAEVNCCHSQVPCHQWTPLHHAAQKGHMEVVQLLVQHGANPRAILRPDDNFLEGTYDTPCDLAIRHGHVAIADYLATLPPLKTIKRIAGQRVMLEEDIQNIHD